VPWPKAPVGRFKLTAVSYGLEQVYLLQDIVAWRPSVWDRYKLSEKEEAFVKVGAGFLRGYSGSVSKREPHVPLPIDRTDVLDCEAC
jgi:hypothetical protein